MFLESQPIQPDGVVGQAVADMDFDAFIVAVGGGFAEAVQLLIGGGMVASEDELDILAGVQFNDRRAHRFGDGDLIACATLAPGPLRRTPAAFNAAAWALKLLKSAVLTLKSDDLMMLTEPTGSVPG